MPRKLIQRYMPHPDSIKNNNFLKIFGKVIHDPQLWHLTRLSVSHAFVVGLFSAFIPIPFQMIVAAGGAVIFRANIAISVALVWITNPLTMPALFGLAYFVGFWTLGMSTDDLYFEWSWKWFTVNGGPFLLGCFICGVVSAIVGYIGVRLFWRYHIISAWNSRTRKRKAKLSQI